MKRPGKRDRFPTGPGGTSQRRILAAFLLFLAVSASRAEDLLTPVIYTDGSSTYTLLDGAGKPISKNGNGTVNLVHAGMSFPSLTQVDTSGDGKILISPISQIKYLVYPHSQVVNEALSYHAEDEARTIDYRLRILNGTVVGDVQGLPHNVSNEIVTPLGKAFTSNGHFLISVRPDGSTKFGVLVGTLTINLNTHGTMVLAANQVLNVLSESEKARLLADHQDEIVGGSPDQVERESAVALLNAGGEDLKITPLQLDVPALALLTAVLPDANADQFSGPVPLPQLALLPGELPPFFNPEDILNPGSIFLSNGTNPANTGNNPPVSPITP